MSLGIEWPYKRTWTKRGRRWGVFFARGRTGRRKWMRPTCGSIWTPGRGRGHLAEDRSKRRGQAAKTGAHLDLGILQVMRLALGAGLLVAVACYAGSLDSRAVQREFDQAARGFRGRVGVCASDGAHRACINSDRRFSLQSVMKLVVGMAVMDAVDRRGWSLDEQVTLRKQDLSLYVQPLANFVNRDGVFATTVGDLVRRAIVDSDSAATDFLIARLGGPKAVQEFLDRQKVQGVRIDRDERRLQTEIVGLTWRPEFTAADVLDQAIAQVPRKVRDAANRRYQRDVRDTATPRGMADLLQSLATGKLLSSSSSRQLIEVMKQTVTFPDRLKAGTPPGWTLAHKTGTSGAWNGVTTATNDVGILIAPDGEFVSIAVFIADSAAPERDRAALMAKLAAAVAANYRPTPRLLKNVGVPLPAVAARFR